MKSLPSENIHPLSHYREDERQINKYFLILLLSFMVYLTFEMNDIFLEGVLAKEATTPSCCSLH